ncbi:hypothetical protein BAUCODRAFT_148622 [Baudoinia panamericana UAMH 10762]|uniref:Uncharacterized protein n=1 Tax=Baudoinia panamericana (strain UAMH 10762) TaxID=717646 RepID=M2MW09_BAUPA|nr:uncharacterized protein BAUCODRAFT_148622 [Baudoinia panamericana UAMH 10762]EMC95743.1 hypothetical protein BAUCODRAFT_148622 [Baudoinia panamericana UAMH 10762]
MNPQATQHKQDSSSGPALKPEHIKPTTIAEGHASGTTSPDHPNTVSSGSRLPHLKRSDSSETLLTSLSEETVTSEPSLIYPNAPKGTPRESVAGDVPHSQSHELHVSDLSAKLRAMPTFTTGEFTPPTSVKDPQGKAQKTVAFTEPVARDTSGNVYTPTHGTPNARNLPAVVRAQTIKFKADVAEYHAEKARREAANDSRAATPTQTVQSPPSKLFPEHSTWADLAEEDVSKGLQRLFRVARDEHSLGSSKTIEEYYSQRLGKLLKGAEIRFDPKYLQ